MKTRLTFTAAVFLFVINLAFAGGNKTTQTRELTGFRGIEVGSNFIVNVTQGETYSFSMTGESSRLTNTRTVIKNGILSIADNNNNNCYKSCDENKFCDDENGITINITCPKLDIMRVSGAARLTLIGEFKSDNMEIALSGAAQQKGQINAQTLTFNASGASRSTLTGVVQQLNVKMSGASRADLSGLDNKHCNISTSGASSISIHTESLNAEASGASQVRYSGNPQVTRSSATGSGNISSDRK